MMEQYKVCMIDGQATICGRWIGSAIARHPAPGQAFATWEVFVCLPPMAQCETCRNTEVRDDAAIGRLNSAGLSHASSDHILSVSLFCGALAGALDPKLRALIADYIAHGDPSPLLDLAEQRGLHEGGYGPERYEEWAEAVPHEHAWLSWESGDAERTLGVFPGFRDASRFRRCPCGVFEHEHEQLLEQHGLSEAGARHFERLQRRYSGTQIIAPPPRVPFDI